MRSFLARQFRGTDAPASAASLAERDPKTIRTACILDEFSFGSYSPELELHPLPYKGWKPVLEGCELLFCESSWAGSGGQWSFKKLRHRHRVKHITRLCRKRGIPSVFWCKEDPPHFDMFLWIAARFDYVFTSEAACVPRYKVLLRHDRVRPLMFAAQPAAHFPEPERKGVGCGWLGGSVYQRRYPERGAALRMMFDAALPYSLVIYDRNSGRDHPFYKFPKEYADCVRPKLPYDQIDRAYKDYAVSININTVTDSETMFSRRVFELLACGTPVLSNPSVGMEKLFPMVAAVRTEEEAAAALNRLLSDEDEWRRVSEAGIKAVFEGHTYAHRAAELLAAIQYIK